MKQQKQPPEYSKQAKKFLDTSTANEDELTESDLTYIRVAEMELTNGETTSHMDIDWS